MLVTFNHDEQVVPTEITRRNNTWDIVYIHLITQAAKIKKFQLIYILKIKSKIKVNIYFSKTKSLTKKHFSLPRLQ